MAEKAPRRTAASKARGKTPKQAATGNADEARRGSGQSLVIVESPSKAKTILKYLGKPYRVMASVGHVKDLPKSGIGVDLEHDFAPEYVTIKGKGKILADIKSAAKAADAIYLASDPDREGEAIAWHIAEDLKAQDGRMFRVLFNEITEAGIRRAMQAPTVIDMKKVHAQQARRVLDRIVGYKISPLLWEKVRYGLSAGRVQSVAIRMICDREREIRAFVSEESWDIAVLLQPVGQAADATSGAFWARLIQQAGAAVDLHTEAEATAIASVLPSLTYAVSGLEKKERLQRPQAPFITSRLQQDAVRKLHFSPQKTMVLAQQLYEGIDLGAEGPAGLITYMRTDAVRISPDFQRETLDWIAQNYGRAYCPSVPNVYKSKKRAQEAHEAIRPTSLSRDPERVRGHLSSDQYRLYALIWKRYVASQMAPAVFDVTRVDIVAGAFTLRATGTRVRFDGFTVVYTEGHEEGIRREEDADQGDATLPPLAVGEALSLRDVRPKQHFTQPPPRYNEALLIHDMEENGIGRPSTYAATLSTIQEREYAERREGRFHPTDLGALVNDLLVTHFPEVVSVEFTATMEDQLDQIEAGETGWVETLRDFYTPFSKRLEAAQVQMKDMKKEERPTDLVCEKCGRVMMIKWGRLGRYLSCAGYPDCKNTNNFVETEGGVKIVPKETLTDQVCAQCGKFMAIKTGRFGRFMACTGYPDCKNAQPLPVGVACPQGACGGQLVEKQSRRGKIFYSCNRYPICQFALWDRPLPHACPQCQSPYLVEKRGASGAVKTVCPNAACGFREG